MNRLKLAWTTCAIALVAVSACQRRDVDLRYRAEQELWRHDRRLSDLLELSPRSYREDLISLAGSYEALAQRVLQQGRTEPLPEEILADMRGIAADALFRSAEISGAVSDSTAVERIFLSMAGEFARDREVASQVALERGRIAEYRGDLRTARAQYELVTETVPHDGTGVEAQLRLAELAGKEGEWLQAVAILEPLAIEMGRGGAAAPRAAEIDLRLLEARIAAGTALKQSLENAREVQTKHAQSDLGARAVLLVAEASARRGEDALALTLASEVLEHSKDTEDLSRALRLRGQLLERADDWPRALAAFRELQILYPVSAAALQAHLDQVDHFMRVGDQPGTAIALGKAERALQDFLASYPRGVHTDLARQLLLETLSHLGKQEEAVLALMDFAEHSAGTPSEAALLLAAARRSAAMAGGRDRALELLDRIAAEYPKTQMGAWSAQEAYRLRSLPPQ